MQNRRPLSKQTVSGHYRPTSETPFKWRCAGGPIVVRFNMYTGLYAGVVGGIGRWAMPLTLPVNITTCIKVQLQEGIWYDMELTWYN